ARSSSRRPAFLGTDLLPIGGRIPTCLLRRRPPGRPSPGSRWGSHVWLRLWRCDWSCGPRFWVRGRRLVWRAGAPRWQGIVLLFPASGWYPCRSPTANRRHLIRRPPTTLLRRPLRTTRRRHPRRSPTTNRRHLIRRPPTTLLRRPLRTTRRRHPRRSPTTNRRHLIRLIPSASLALAPLRATPGLSLLICLSRTVRGYC